MVGSSFGRIKLVLESTAKHLRHQATKFYDLCIWIMSYLSKDYDGLLVIEANYWVATLSDNYFKYFPIESMSMRLLL